MGPRIQFFEIQDSPRCPAGIRDVVTDWLQFVLTLLGLYRPAVPILRRALERARKNRLVDLCSGGSGPLASLVQQVPTTALLTDKFPNTPHLEAMKQRGKGALDYVATSVDATAVPAELDGVRTMFTSFHHFDDAQGKAILKSAYEARSPIAIFEFTERSVYSLLMTAPTPVMMWLFTPLLWPWRWRRFLWTYLIPLGPLVAGFDVLVSVMRTRNEKELLALTEGLDGGGYTWEAGRARSTFGMPIIYLLGLPPAAAKST